MEVGYNKGDICNRNGCQGIINEHESDSGCSCHINPPCSYCTDSRSYCTECDWDGRQEQIEADKASSKYWEEYHKRPDVIALKKAEEESERSFFAQYSGKEPITEFRYRIKSSGNSTMTLHGVYPEGMKIEEILKKVRGTFGGKFTRLANGKFEYIAYTD